MTELGLTFLGGASPPAATKLCRNRRSVERAAAAVLASPGGARGAEAPLGAWFAPFATAGRCGTGPPLVLPFLLLPLMWCEAGAGARSGCSALLILLQHCRQHHQYRTSDCVEVVLLIFFLYCFVMPGTSAPPQSRPASQSGPPHDQLTASHAEISANCCL